jgi:hypothetical protein
MEHGAKAFSNFTECKGNPAVRTLFSACTAFPRAHRNGDAQPASLREHA